jgi:hypothetical protein
MLKDVVQVECLNGYRLRLRFEDGVEGVVDVSELVEFYFVQVDVNPDVGTICWPNGADLDPDVLYAAITGEPIDVSETAGAFLP